MKHRFALCSDTHGKPPPIFAETDVDAVLHAGDFYHGPDILEPAGRLNALQEWIKSISIPVFAVRGNHDFLDPAGFFLRAHDLTGHVQRLSPNLLIAGLGLAYPKYSDLPTNRNLLEASTRILVEARRLTLQSSQKNDYLLLLSHYPAPAPSLPDPSQGYDAIATLLTQLETEFEIRPLAVIEGHLHNMPRAPDHLSLHSCNIPCDIPIFRPGPQGAILQINDDTWQMHYDPD